MKIIDFIKSNNNWKEILTSPPYSLSIKEKGKLVLFNYSQILTDTSIPLTWEACGLILEKDTWKPICYGFNRFFNLGEPNAAKIDWKSSTATSKEDGTLFFLYYYDDEWHVKTRSTFDAVEAPLNNEHFNNYKELFDYLIQFNPNFSFSELNKNYTYCMEGCSVFNRIVIDYPTPTLYHILTRDMRTLEEVECDIGVHKPALYFLEDEEAYTDFVKTFGEDHEGIVVKDKYNNRVKIKTEHYFMLHFLTNKMVLTLRRTIDLIRKNDYEELLVYFPHYRPWIEEVKAKLAKAAQRNEEIKTEVVQLKEQFQTRKDFATWIDANIIKRERRLYMLAYEDRLDEWFNYNGEMKEELEICRVKQIISTYELDK